MKRSTLALVVVPLAAAAGILCVLNFAQAARTRARTATLVARQGALENELRQRTTHLQQPSPRPAAISSKPSPRKPPPPPDASTLMAHNPALRDLFQRYSQAELGFRFRPFYHAAKLSPEMISRFQALILEQREEQMDLASASAASGITPADATRLRQDLEQRHDAEQRQLLGDENYGKYRDFTRIEPMEAAVASVATLGAETGEPLTEAQGEQLLTILAHASETYRRGGVADIWTIDLSRLLEQARSVLSPHQFSVLQGSADMAEAFQLAKEYQIQHGYGAPR